MDLDEIPVDIFTFDGKQPLFLSSVDYVPIGYYAFPFVIRLKETAEGTRCFRRYEILESAIISSPIQPSSSLDICSEYFISGFATKDSAHLLKSRTNFFVWSPDASKKDVATSDCPLHLHTNAANILTIFSTKLCEPLVVQLDKQIIPKQNKNANSKPTNGFLKAFSSDLSIHIALDKADYSLGDAVVVVTTPSISESIHIDSISYRVNIICLIPLPVF